MSTRFLQKVSSLDAIRDLPSAGGIGVYAGQVFLNAGNGLVALGVDQPFGKIYYVAKNLPSGNGSDTNSGLTPADAFASMSAALAAVESGDVIVLRGMITEDSLVTPTGVTDVTIVGAATRPRTGNTTTGGPKNGAANWKPSGTPAGPNLTVTQQGWRFVNLQINCPATVYAGILLLRDAGSGVSEKNAGHTSFVGCDIVGPGVFGIENRENVNVAIIDCHLYQFTTTGNIAFACTAGSGVALPLMNEVRRCRFNNNLHHIVGAHSEAVIDGNHFSWKGASVTTVRMIDLTGGKNNHVANNYFGTPADNALNASAFVGGTDDAWGPNHHALGHSSSVTAGVVYGVPTNQT